mmetsp:Transcript_124171/g.356728  ORF Transcript_124171/g.356728 Transcript_124171/m.356728 type:complete len:204 (-) Transcript_124171:196-807(-)
MNCGCLRSFVGQKRRCFLLAGECAHKRITGFRLQFSLGLLGPFHVVVSYGQSLGLFCCLPLLVGHANLLPDDLPRVGWSFGDKDLEHILPPRDQVVLVQVCTSMEGHEVPPARRFRISCTQLLLQPVDAHTVRLVRQCARVGFFRMAGRANTQAYFHRRLGIVNGRDRNIISLLVLNEAYHCAANRCQQIHLQLIVRMPLGES